MVSIETLPTPLANCCMTAPTGRSIQSAPTSDRQSQRVCDRHADGEEEAHAEKENGDIHAWDSLDRDVGVAAVLPGGGPMVRRSTDEQKHHGAADDDREVGNRRLTSKEIRRPNCPRWSERASIPRRT